MLAGLSITFFVDVIVMKLLLVDVKLIGSALTHGLLVSAKAGVAHIPYHGAAYGPAEHTRRIHFR